MYAGKFDRLEGKQTCEMCGATYYDYHGEICPECSEKVLQSFVTFLRNLECLDAVKELDRLVEGFSLVDIYERGEVRQ